MNEHPLESILEIFIEYLDLQPSTIKSYEGTMNRYINYLNKKKKSYSTSLGIIK
ncbi:MAG: hypothetical protein PF513_03975 [Tenericutes bacterium]|nr:hypothetical protein [Mycoplasmatota bacterium]